MNILDEYYFFKVSNKGRFSMRKDPLNESEFLAAGFSKEQFERYCSSFQFFYYDLIASAHPILSNSLNWPQYSLAFQRFYSCIANLGIVEDDVDNIMQLLRPNLNASSFICEINGVIYANTFDFVRNKIERLLAGSEPAQIYAMEHHCIHLVYDNKRYENLYSLSGAERFTVKKDTDGNVSLISSPVPLEIVRRLLQTAEKTIEKKERMISEFKKAAEENTESVFMQSNAEKLCVMNDKLYELTEFSGSLDTILLFNNANYYHQYVSPLVEEGIPRWKYANEVIGGPKSFESRPKSDSGKDGKPRIWVPVYQGGQCMPK